MKVMGTRDRKSKESSGETKVYNIRRLGCVNCGRIHHELPDFLVPYKRYEAECIEKVLTDSLHHDIPSTLFRWLDWFTSFVEYWIGCLTSIMFRIQGKSPVNLSSEASLSALQRIGRWVGDAPRWLARIVRPIANDNLWLHTRSAFLSEGD